MSPSPGERPSVSANTPPPESGPDLPPLAPWATPPTRRLDDPSDGGHPSYAAGPPVLPELRPGEEPVPGYRLVARIGRGGSGEVWRAVGPGGFPSAIKVTWAGAEGGAELQSLELMREVRHAHLLPLFGAWRRDGLLFVGMELVDGTLADRRAEAVARGLPGVPFPELVEYMGQAARGLDHLAGYRPVRVQHCDVKPQNLLLVGGTVKVGDFGLVRPLAGATGTPAGLTPAFAAPEVGQGRLSDRSDQYSLAVTYCLLRGGRLPFTGNTCGLLLRHALDAPDLTMLPAAERPAVARALAKRPEDRWPDCRAFVRGLEAAGRPAAAPGLAPAGRPWTRAGRRAVAAAGLAAILAGIAGSPPVPPDLGVSVPATPGAFGRPTREVVAAAPSVPAPPLPAPRAVRPASPTPPPAARAELLPPPRPVASPPADDRLRQAAAAGRAMLGDLERGGRAVAALAADAAGGVAAALPPARWPAVRLPAVPRTATIRVLMPAAGAELVVRGEVGRGNPDEWYGPERVIHTPPLGAGADYLVGAFWTDRAGRPQTPKVEIKVEPGRVYQVDLRLATPGWSEVRK